METFYTVSLATLETVSLGSSLYGNERAAANEAYTHFVLADGYTVGMSCCSAGRWPTMTAPSSTASRWKERQPEQTVPLTGFGAGAFTPGGGLLITTVLFDDHYGLAYLPLDQPASRSPPGASLTPATANWKLLERAGRQPLPAHLQHRWLLLGLRRPLGRGHLTFSGCSVVPAR